MKAKHIKSVGYLQRGITLIELLIVVAIIGILAQVAMPGYSQYIVEQRRGDAHHLLKTNAQLLQRCLTLAGSYAGFTAPDGTVSDCNIHETSSDGHYTLESTLTAQTWSLVATPAAGGKQQHDADCTSFTLDHTGLKSATGNKPDVCW